MPPTPRRADVLASNLLYLAFFLPLLSDFINDRGHFNPDKPAVDYTWVYALVLFSLGLYYAIRRGLRWAKVLAVLLIALSLVATALRFEDVVPWGAGPVVLLVYVLQKLLQVVATALMVKSLFLKKAPTLLRGDQSPTPKP